MFWDSTPSTRLTPNSIFGQGLHAPAVYIAVASAMERARRDQHKAIVPVRRVFEMPAILRSYYDPMILAAVLRWLQPHEAWWGLELADEGVAVESLLSHVPLAHQLILVPEILLAAAQGKLNRPGITATQSYASALLSNPEVSAEEKAPIELALALVPDYGTADGERRVERGARSAIERAESPAELLDLVPEILQDLRTGRLTPEVAGELSAKIRKLKSQH